MTLKLIRGLIFSLFVMAVIFSSNSEAGNGLGVCNVLKNAKFYTNKDITIHANLITGIHGILAFDDTESMSCGVIFVYLSVAVYDSLAKDHSIMPDWINGGIYHAVINGDFTYHRSHGRSRVRGILYLHKILSWKPRDHDRNSN